MTPGKRPTGGQATRWLVGIDIGGTFTDAVAVEAGGKTVTAKVPSTPSDPADGLVNAIVSLRQSGCNLADIGHLFHGTTIATNALINGIPTHIVLLTTEGFRDILSYTTGSRSQVYSLKEPKQVELVRRRDRIEVRERLSSRGEVVKPLTDIERLRVLEEVGHRQPEAIAVCLLFSYVNDSHEQVLGRELTKRFPQIPISLSSDVAREFREYPRTTTTVVNAALRPLVGRYLLDSKTRIDDLGMDCSFLVMQSNGGSVPAERAAREAHKLILSGPSAGVAGALAVQSQCGLKETITLDMGGTSLDVCLIRDGIPPVSATQVADGRPILSAAIDIHTAGAGGGSIARVDASGRLRVGPQSAGADPGPAAYGLGGTEATLTDAHVVVGSLTAGSLLAGRLALDPEASRAVIRRIADALHMGLDEAARGIVAVATAHVVRAVRRISVERGVDPRTYTLVAYGGAGPLHAAELIRELGLAAVVIPPYPGLFSASGLLATDLRVDEAQTVLTSFSSAVVDELEAWFNATAARLVGQLRSDGVPKAKIRIVASADCRYLGQGYSLNVRLRGTRRAELMVLPGAFNDLHFTTYGHADRKQLVEIVTLRLSAFGMLDRPPTARKRARRTPVQKMALVGRRKILFPTGARMTPIYRRDELRAGNRFPGPAVVEQMDSTTVVSPEQSADVDGYGNIWIRERTSR